MRFERLVHREIDEVPRPVAVIQHPAKGESVQHVVEKRTVAELGCGECTGHVSFGRLVVKDEHHTCDRAVRRANGRGTVGNGALRAILGDQDGVVGQSDDGALAQHPADRVFAGFERALVGNAENLVQRFCTSLRLEPAGEILGDPVHLFDLPLGIRRDDGIANAVQRGAELLLCKPFFLFRFVQHSVVSGLVLAMQRDKHRGSEQDQQDYAKHDDQGSETALDHDFIGIHLGDEEPGRAGNRPQIGQHFLAAVVPALNRLFDSQHGLNGRNIGLGQGEAKRQSFVRGMPKPVHEQDLVAVFPNQQGFRTAAGHRPRLNQWE